MQTISDTGDLVLVMDQSVRLIVSSAHLIAASSTFKAMLTGPFAEGRQTVSPKEIELPDDNPDSMIVLMNILHHRNHFVPMSPGTQQMLMVAKLADKYDCTASVKFVSYTWSHQIKTGFVSMLDHITMVATSYLLHDHRTFRFHTRSLVMEHTWTVGGLLGALDHDALPDTKQLQLALAMERHRGDAFRRLEIVAYGLERCRHLGVTSCTVSADTISGIKAFLHATIHRDALIGFAKLTPKDVIDRLHLYKGTDAPWGDHRHLTARETEKALFDLVKRADESIHGLCLICLRKGSKHPENCTDHLGVDGDIAQAS